MAQQVIRDIEYRRAGGQGLCLDLHLPGGAGPHPVIAWIHGGGWSTGTKDWCEGLAGWIVPSGFALAAVDYRLSGLAPFPAQIEDCKAAVRWVRAHAAEYGLDARHVGAWGDSAGGHLVELLGTTGGVSDFDGGGAGGVSAAIQAGCALFAPSDLTGLATAGDAVTGLLGGPPHQRPDEARLASPLARVGPDACPFLLVHGAADALVPPGQSERFRDALQAAGRPCDLITLAGVGHEGKPIHALPEVREAIRAFFGRYLKARP